MHNYGELRNYINIPDDRKLNIPDSVQRDLIHGYYACVSYIDYEIGKLINHLKELKIYDNSVIVLWGDHGWQLGEHNLWAKHCNYQTSLKVPLLIKYSNQKAQRKISSVVELLDLYPTLCDLSNIQKPKHLQGKSLININEDNPNNLNGFSNYHNGFTITNKDYSYTVWKNKEGDIKAEMMYDLNLDSDENNNVSNNTANSPKILEYRIFLDSIKWID
jgi:arylsulfatase A-like enzyme